MQAFAVVFYFHVSCPLFSVLPKGDGSSVGHGSWSIPSCHARSGVMLVVFVWLDLFLLSSSVVFFSCFSSAILCMGYKFDVLYLTLSFREGRSKRWKKEKDYGRVYFCLCLFKY